MSAALALVIVFIFCVSTVFIDNPSALFVDIHCTLLWRDDDFCDVRREVVLRSQRSSPALVPLSHNVGSMCDAIGDIRVALDPKDPNTWIADKSFRDSLEALRGAEGRCDSLSQSVRETIECNQESVQNAMAAVQSALTQSAEVDFGGLEKITAAFQHTAEELNEAGKATRAQGDLVTDFTRELRLLQNIFSKPQHSKHIKAQWDMVVSPTARLTQVATCGAVAMTAWAQVIPGVGQLTSLFTALVCGALNARGVMYDSSVSKGLRHIQSVESGFLTARQALGAHANLTKQVADELFTTARYLRTASTKAKANGAAGTLIVAQAGAREVVDYLKREEHHLVYGGNAQQFLSEPVATADQNGSDEQRKLMTKGAIVAVLAIVICFSICVTQRRPRRRGGANDIDLYY